MECPSLHSRVLFALPQVWLPAETFVVCISGKLCASTIQHLPFSMVGGSTTCKNLPTHPHALLVRDAVYTSYKHLNTVLFIIGVELGVSPSRLSWTGAI